MPATQFDWLTFGIAQFGNDQGWTSFSQNPRQVADVNGDGMDDIVGFGSGGTYVALATGGGNFGPLTYRLGQFGNDQGWSSFNQNPRQLADVNGDGMADIVGFGSGGTYVALATGGGNFGPLTYRLGQFGSASEGGGWSSFDHIPRTLADVNGDDMADIVGFGNGGTYVALATGGGQFGPLTYRLGQFGNDQGWGSFDHNPRTLADVNGDDMADIVGFGSGGTYVALATGGGNFGPLTYRLGQFGSASEGGGWSSFDRYPRTLADVNGDAMADIVGFGDAGAYLALASAFHVV